MTSMKSFTRYNVALRAACALCLSLSLTSFLPVCAKREKPASAEDAKPVRKVKPESAECAACYKEASKLFAASKSTDAYKLLKANQLNCKDSARFNLLLSTVLLRMPSHEKEAAQAAALAVDLEPSSIAANFQLALCLSASGDSEKAAQAYEKLIKLDPTNYEAWSALGTIYSELHDTQKSRICAAKAAVLEPNSRLAKIRTAQNLFKQGKPDAVSAELNRLINDDQMEPEFYIGLAKDALNMQAFSESSKAADKVIAAYPQLAEVLKTKATAQLWMRNYAGGLETISRLDPPTRATPDVMAIRSLLLVKLGKTKEAKGLIAKLPNKTDDESLASLASLARGFLAELNGDVDDATRQFEASLRHNQIFAPPHIELARIYLRQGKAEDVLAEAREVQRSKPYVSSGKAFESRLALEDAPARERVAEALKLARESVKLNAEDPEALVALAMSELKGGRIQEAQEAVKKAQEIEPGNVDVQLTSVKILEGEGKTAKRLEALQVLRDMAPGDSEVLVALADAHAANGDLSSAIKLLRERVDSGAEPTVVFALARAYERSGRSKEAGSFFQQSLSRGLKGKKALLAKEALRNLGGGSADAP